MGGLRPPLLRLKNVDAKRRLSLRAFAHPTKFYYRDGDGAVFAPVRGAFELLRWPTQRETLA